MKSQIVINRADHAHLESLLNGTIPPPLPDPDQQVILHTLLASATVVREGHAREQRHAGFHDRITLVSPKDSMDYYKFSIVLPREADIDAEHISVLTPLCLAVLGRACGQMVTWETPVGTREMRIIAIEKAGTLAAA
ncbi:MAG: GreA/GreB family elongation factor [Verrucomicrobiaceae bacterium]|nr:MAG: GreA/GreB family elongation factor [Verrucomicrobiaceae bacterium]